MESVIEQINPSRTCTRHRRAIQDPFDKMALGGFNFCCNLQPAVKKRQAKSTLPFFLGPVELVCHGLSQLPRRLLDSLAIG